MTHDETSAQDATDATALGASDPHATDAAERESSSHARSPLLRTLPAKPFVSGFVAALGVLAAIALGAAFASLGSVILSVFLGLFLALGLTPLVENLARRGVSRGLSLSMVIGAIVALFALIILFIVPPVVAQLIHAVSSAPQFAAELAASDWAEGVQEQSGIDIATIVGDLAQSLADTTSFLAIAGGILQIGSGTVGVVSSVVMVLVLTVYFVSAIDPMKRALAELTPAYRRESFSRLLDQTTGLVGHFVAGGITLAALNACVVFVLQLLLGSPIALLLAIAAFFITIVPLVGSLIFLVVGTTTSLFLSPWAALIFAVAYFVYIQIEAYVITPRIMGKAVQVPGILVIIGAMVGSALMGLLGALVAVPVTASILIIIREVVVPRQDAVTRDPALA